MRVRMRWGDEKGDCICLVGFLGVLGRLESRDDDTQGKRRIMRGRRAKVQLQNWAMIQEQTMVHNRIDMNYDFARIDTTFPAPAAQSLPPPSTSPAYSSSHP